ncbi:uncharacterized protein (TIGR01732 family) [Caldalkalibacillus uzonensis]|uniref:Uncharacterized protein (TIGR01732 family) n=1 Tax=Caldalkalibacillus uzonensis TaxID=353224 RepID=A0ABU0CVA4_9BACI|nr:YjcZ family sporulation protein [Caldalkalibacillus uzonensis]MDQ0340357.1 uncharacterized protein (TIGR01732 family) [Caldalkalibacillus uzonensis]
MSCCGRPVGYGPVAGYPPVTPIGGGFALIVVLFILLIIVGCGCFLGFGT